MTLTEEEARTKWCPMHRVAIDGSMDVYGNMPNRQANTCAAGLCMAWRWDTAAFDDAIECYEDSPNIGGITARETPVCRGYCGLAGKP